jgi:hypothetical protein
MDKAQSDTLNNAPQDNLQVNPIVSSIVADDFFNKDKKLSFLHRKIEKLIAAIYILTAYFSDEEPSKWVLRNLFTRLLHACLLLKSSSHSHSAKLINEIRGNIVEIISILDVVSAGGLISSMNVIIFKRELQILLGHISNIVLEKEKNENSTSEALGEKYIETKEETSSIKDKIDVLYDENELGDSKLPIGLSEKDEKLRDFSSVAVKRNKRQSIIVALIKKKKEIIIKDVSEVLKDCSEKTIQRELQNLVKEGIVKRRGARRWTRYSLV